MQREQVSILKIILYVLTTIIIYVLQSSITARVAIQGFHIDLLPCCVIAAAMLGGPVEGLVIGVLAGLLYDLGYAQVEGLYPIFFLIFGVAVGSASRSTLSKNYLSVVILTFLEMLVLGVLRYFIYQLPVQHAPFGLVVQQVLVGAVLTAAFGFIAYLPLRAIGRRFGEQ